MNINVINRDGYRIGAIIPAVGMNTKGGVIEKVNGKSLVIRNAAGVVSRVTDQDYVPSVSYIEATRFGFDLLPVPEHAQEVEADKRKRFAQGEFSFNNQLSKPERDSAAIAGWEFAEATARLRQIILSSL